MLAASARHHRRIPVLRASLAKPATAAIDVGKQCVDGGAQAQHGGVSITSGWGAQCT